MTATLERPPVELRPQQRATIDWGPALVVAVRKLDPRGLVRQPVVFVVWVYYAAMLFILGGEVAQVYELRRVRRAQREVLE